MSDFRRFIECRHTYRPCSSDKEWDDFLVWHFDGMSRSELKCLYYEFIEDKEKESPDDHELHLKLHREMRSRYADYDFNGTSLGGAQQRTDRVTDERTLSGIRNVLKGNCDDDQADECDHQWLYDGGESYGCSRCEVRVLKSWADKCAEEDPVDETRVPPDMCDCGYPKPHVPGGVFCRK